MQQLLIVEDSFQFRQALVFWVSNLKNVELLGEFENGRAALNFVRSVKPDIVLVDVFMRGMDGLTLTWHIRSMYPDIQIIVMTSSLDKHVVKRALEAGASQVIFKEDIATAIHGTIISAKGVGVS